MTGQEAPCTDHEDCHPYVCQSKDEPEQSAAYRPPTYREAVVPDGGRFGANPLTLPVCSHCGALTLDQHGHDRWHAELWVALSGSSEVRP